jgi:hypothetical protein
MIFDEKIELNASEVFSGGGFLRGPGDKNGIYKS